MFKKYFLLLFISALFLFANLDVYSQCAMCKAVATSNVDSKQNNVGKGINKGVMYLLVTPYLLVGASIIYIYRNRRKEST